jgi:signal transduction histidine kinase
LELKYIYTDLELFGAVFCWIAAFYLLVSRSLIKKQYKALGRLEIAIGVVLFFDAFAWFFRGVPGQTAYVMVLISNFMNFFAYTVIPVCYAIYVSLSIDEEAVDRRLIGIVSTLATIAVVFLIASQFTGYVYKIDRATNLYSRGQGFSLLTSIYVFQLVVGILFIYSHRNTITRPRMWALLSFIFLPTLAAVVQIYLYGYSLSNIACIVSGLVMFAQALDDNANSMLEREIFINKQSDELTDMRTKIALSQISPEFICDTLNSVYELCDRDVERAKEVVVHLSNYLRQNIESISTDRLITFEKELNHTMVYLELEKTRNPGRFEVEYHVDETFFLLPALTVQPLVENALTYGIYTLPPEKKGKVIISSSRGNGYVKVEVKDNGGGFDVDQSRRVGALESEQFSINNVKNRLKIMENAELHVKSKLGGGTSIIIIIPVKNPEEIG